MLLPNSFADKMIHDNTVDVYTKYVNICILQYYMCLPNSILHVCLDYILHVFSIKIHHILYVNVFKLVF